MYINDIPKFSRTKKNPSGLKIHELRYVSRPNFNGLNSGEKPNITGLTLKRAQF